MFDKPTVDSYRQISAPPSLKAKVMALSETEKPVRQIPYRIVSIAAAAACLVLVAVGAILGLPADELTVTYNGAPITSEGAVILPDENQPAMFSARMLPPVSVTLSVTADEPTDISVSSGFVKVYADDSLITSGTDCTASGILRVEWLVSLMPGQTESITIGGSEYSVTHAEDGISTIRES